MRTRALVVLFASLFVVILLAFCSRDAEARPGPAIGRQIFSTSAATGIAAVDTKAGYRIVVSGMYLRSSAAGVVVLKDGSNAGAVLLNLYLEADTPMLVRSEMFGNNVKTTAGNCLFFADQDATLTGWVDYSKQL